MWYNNIKSSETEKELAALREENKLLKKQLEASKLNNEQGNLRERYALKILEALPVTMTVMNRDEEIVRVMSAHGKRNVDYIVGKHLSDIVSSTTYNRVHDEMLKVLSGSEGEGHTIKHDVDLKGEHIYLKSDMVSLDDNNVIFLSRNITDEKNRLMELEMFKAVLDMVSDCIVAVSPDADFVFANRQFMKEYGVSQDDFNSKKAYEKPASFSSKEEFELLTKKIQDNGGSLTYSATYSHGDNIQRVHQITAFSSYNSFGDNNFWFFMRDVTELVSSRDELRELNYLMDTILNNIPLYVFVKDIGDGYRYLYWNKAFADHSGIPASKVIGKTDFEIFPDQADAERFRCDDIEVVESGEVKDIQETYMTMTGERRVVKTQKYRVNRDGRSPLLLGVSWDITDFQDIEQKLIQERIRAEQSDRLKSAFLANMSHEIRTPLNAIVGFSNLLTEENTPQEDKMYSDIIHQNSDMLLQLINDILDISKIEAGTLEYVRRPMDLGDVCRNLYEMHKERVNDGVTLFLDNEKDRLVINEDRNRVTQVINNFITNAIKFTDEGEIRFGFKIVGNNIEVYVKDTGLGIAPDKLDSVFDRFVKLNSFAQGTGLGLSICKMIAGKMNGDVSVESELGKGSTFKLTIPYKVSVGVAAPDQAQSPSVPSVSENSDSEAQAAVQQENKMKTILVAEDVHSNYLLLKSMIGKKFNLIWAQDGNTAIEYFKKHNPDLILMDIKMPVMNGLDATRIIRTISNTIPIIALTAFAFDSDKDRAMEAGCNGYLTKPVSKKLLLDALDKFLKN